MAVLSRKEFAGLCGCPVKIINTYVSRGKVIVGYDKTNLPLDEFKKIDSEHPTNKDFFEKRIKLNESRKEILPPIVEVIPPASTTKKVSHKRVTNNSKEALKSAEEKSKVDLEIQKRKNDILALELRKKKADTELTEHKAELEKVKLDKLAGKLLPLELHDDILGNYTRSIFTKFHSYLDNLASVYTDVLAAGDRSKLSEISGKIAETLDEIIKSTEEVAKLGTDKAISDYADVRSRGEKK